jgi:hypothetical protein
MELAIHSRNQYLRFPQSPFLCKAQLNLSERSFLVLECANLGVLALLDGLRGHFRNLQQDGKWLVWLHLSSKVYL